MQSQDLAQINARLAAEVVGTCARLGVTDVCLCAGARNAPLVVALTSLAEAGREELRLWHFFDERAAGFFALGCSARGGLGAVVTTSGTAAAEVLPAVIEGHCAGLPLLVITADRPARYRGSVAPQAIEQVGIFGGYVEACADVACQPGDDVTAVLMAALSQVPWERRRPWHWNVCFDEPLLGGVAEIPSDLAWEFPVSSGDGSEAPRFRQWLEQHGHALLVLVGGLDPSFQQPVARWLLAGGFPVWAEATSGLRECLELQGQLLCGGEAAFAGATPSAVLRIGDVPSLRWWRDLESSPDIPVFSVSRAGWTGLARKAGAARLESFVWPDPAPQIQDRTWWNSGVGAQKTLESLLQACPSSEPAIFRALSEHIPTAVQVFLGNSLPIREWNLAATRERPHPRVRASRGANGIDGQVATWLGHSVEEGESWGIFGDLTALYDLNAPWIMPQLPPGRRTLVVIHNGGGRIFSRVPGLARLPERARRITENRHALNLAGWAVLWDMDHHRLDAGTDLPGALAALPGVSDHRLRLLEIHPDEADTERFWRSWK